MSNEIQKIRVSPDCELAVRVDDYVLPWETRPPVIMLHGLAESGETFRRWVPHFASHHLVIRPDLRGYGASTPMRGDYEYKFANLGKDIIAMMDKLHIQKANFVGAKIGGTLALHLAANFSDRVIAVAAVGTPASLTSFSERAPTWRKQIRQDGVEKWVKETTESRLGTSLPKEAIEWWVAMMSKTPASTLEAFLKMVPTVDVIPELSKVKCPTLVLTTTGSMLGSVDAVKAWQQLIPNSQLDVIEGDSYHVAATHPDQCAQKVRNFIDSLK